MRKFAADIVKSESRLDILINNAGCALFGKSYTEDGNECQMQSNHFGHFLLTNLLLGKNIMMLCFSYFLYTNCIEDAVMTDFGLRFDD